MPTDTHPAVRSAAAKRYLPMLGGALEPLAESIQEALVLQLKASGPARRATDRRAVDHREMRAQAEGLKARILAAMEASLGADTPAGKLLRMQLIAMLAAAEGGNPVVSVQAVEPAADAWLTTADAAARLDVSRPHVAMLCDAGRLGEVKMTEGGHRRLRASAVDAYLEGRSRSVAGAPSPRAAGLAAGLYDQPDDAYRNVVRGELKAAKPAASDAGKPAGKRSSARVAATRK